MNSSWTGSEFRRKQRLAPARQFDDLELSLGFGIALRLGQLAYLRNEHPVAAHQFLHNQESTAMMSIAMVLTGIGPNSGFFAALRSVRTDFDPSHELRALFGIDRNRKQSQHLINAVAIATHEFVWDLLDNAQSRVSQNLNLVSAAGKVALGTAWICSVPAIGDYEVFLPASTIAALEGRG